MIAALSIGGLATLGLLSRPESAVSLEAREIRSRFTEVRRAAESSQVLFGKKDSAISSLHEMVSECGSCEPDGEGENMVAETTVRLASDLIRALPENLSLPDFAIEPDGSISVEWIVSRYRRFVISVGEGDRLPYAWVDSEGRGHGVAQFDGVTIPQRVQEILRSILKNECTNVRAA